MKLVEWRKQNGKSQRWVSMRTGIDQALISKYENGVRPLPPNARKIEQATGGQVTLNDWYPAAEAEVPSKVLGED